MNNRLHPLFYIIPFVVFLYLIHDFYNKGHLSLFVDSKVNCIYTNYFLNNIMRGVYPFWNPFSSWGRPDDLLAHMMGEYNPFLYTIVLFQKLGMRFSLAYFGYLILYFTLGIAGIYFLAKELFKDCFLAWLAATLIMFSNLSGNLFNNIFVILIFIPTIWFFYFLNKFTKDPQKAYLLGLTFCLMILVTTYMPFHFLVILLTFSVFYFCIYLFDLPAIIHRWYNFFSKNRVFTLFCLVSFFLSIIPGFLWYRSNLKGDVIYAWRGIENSIFLSRNMIDSGNFISMHALINPISGLKDPDLASLYIPFILILIGFVGMILPLTRRRVLLFIMGSFFFLLTMTDASPLMGFLYQHIFFIKYFRNTHFFIWAFGTFVMLLAIDLFSGLINLQPKKKFGRVGLCIFVIVIHSFIFFILKHFWDVDASSYITLFLSCIFFVLYFAGFLKRENVLFPLMVSVIVLLQPIEVLWHVEHDSIAGQQFPYSMKPYTFKESKPKFSYLRPPLDEEAQLIDTDNRGDITDRSGFIKDIWQYHGTRWSFSLLRGPQFRNNLQEYVRHKFVLYPPHQNVTLGPTDEFPAGQWIDGDSSDFKVRSFDMNHIQLETKFSHDQLLVYNDSFHPAWRAYINGRPVPIILANAAFKGIYLPAGRNEILFSFHSPFYRGFFIFLILYFELVLVILIILIFRRVKYDAIL